MLMLILTIMIFINADFCLTAQETSDVCISWINNTLRQNSPKNMHHLEFVTKEEWGARPDIAEKIDLTLPAKYVVVHDSHVNEICTSKETCSRHLKHMQTIYSISHRNLPISFAIGGDGYVYEVGGWTQRVDLHKGIAVTFLGDYNRESPTQVAKDAFKNLLNFGVDKGHLTKNYKMVTHNQITNANCPGKFLVKFVTTHAHYYNKPHKMTYKGTKAPNKKQKIILVLILAALIG